MKNIKLRIWDKHNEKMIYSYEPEEHGKREYYPFQFDIGFSHWEKDWFSEIMLFTGLKDRKEKEIYENDLIIIEYFDTNESTLLKAKYSCDGSFSGERIKGHDDKYFHCQTYSLRFGGSNVKRFEIIGNIFENPELLK